MITPKKIGQFGVFWCIFGSDFVLYIITNLDKLPFFVNKIMIAFCGIFHHLVDFSLF